MRDDTYPRGAVPVSPEEVGLLDSLASGQCLPDGYAHLRGSCVHAYRMRTLPCERHLVPYHLVRAI